MAEEADRRADPMAAESLREALRAVTEPAQVRFKGIPPEMRVANDLISRHDEQFIARRREEAEHRFREEAGQRASAAAQGAAYRRRRDLVRLQRPGRELAGGVDDARRRAHTSAIARADLSVIIFGVCLSGRDRTTSATTRWREIW